MLGFEHAFRGLIEMIKTERNFKIQVLAFTLVIILGFVLDVSIQDWLILILVSGMVMSLEIINSAIEKICDLYTTEKNEKIRIIKDISAGAVLITALFAFITGILVFLPHIKNIIN